MSNVATIDRAAEVAKPLTFGEQLKAREGQFKASLPAHIPVERFMRIVMTAVQLNPALGNADRQSLWTSSAKAATDGLLPDGREGALVIYKTKDGDRWIDKVQWMPMIAGLRKKVRNSGEIATWDAQVVKAKDHFEFELGDDPFIKHRPCMDGDPGPIIAAYSIATLKSGEKSREVMTKAQLDKVRNASKSKDRGPWVDWPEEMCRKTVARRHSKVLPMNTDIDDLLRRDEDLYDMKGAREAASAANGGPQSLSGQFDALASMPGRGAPAVVEHQPVADEVVTEEPAKEADKPDPTPDPARATLLKKLEPKAAKGTDALRRAIAGLSEADAALLTEADHDALGATADAADRAGVV